MEIKTIAKKLRTEQVKLKDLEEKIGEQKLKVNQLREDMTEAMVNVGTTSYNGIGIKISLRESQVPQATDWGKIYRYVKRNDAFDLFQRRLAVTAWRDRLEDRKTPIPGIETFNKKALYITIKKD